MEEIRVSDRKYTPSLQGDPSARGLGYVDISSISGYPQYDMELMSTKSLRAGGPTCTVITTCSIWPFYLGRGTSTQVNG